MGRKKYLTAEGVLGGQTRQTWQILEKIDKAGGQDFLKKKIPTLEDLRDHQKTPNCQNNKIVLGKLKDLKIYLQI